MTLLSNRPGTDARTTDIAWYLPENNLWVAAANGEHAGLVEFIDGHFVVRNSAGEAIAEAATIPHAQAALVRYLDEPVAAPAGIFAKRMPRPVYLRASLAA